MRFPFLPLKSASPVARANPRKSCARAGLLLILSLGLTLGASGQAGDSAARPRIGTRSGLAATLTGRLTNLRGGRGTCYLALFAGPEGFSRHSEQALRTLHVPVSGPTCVFSFENLPPGSYALAVYHDENGDGKLDTNFLGIPTERYGFSNDARSMMFFPPSFAAARFVVPAAGTAISLRLK